MQGNNKTPSHYRLADQPKVSGSDLGYHRGIPGDGANFLQAHLSAGFRFPMHVHDNEQFTYVLSGASRISFGDGTPPITAHGGEVVHVPGGIPHDLEVIEDTVQIEIFSPARNSLVFEMPGSSRDR